MKSLADEINQKLPFVIYKEPHSSIIHLLQQKNTDLFHDENLETSGFYFYPYDTKNVPAVVFPKDKLVSKKMPYRDFSMDSSPIELKMDESPSLQNSHIQKVEEAIKQLRNNSDFKKVIISSRFPVKIQSFSWQNALLKLMHAYDESMVWVWYHPKIGMWMGATPELLASYQNDEFETMALAGTLPVRQNEPVIWSGKEVREQKLVTDFIFEELKKHAKNINISKPTTIYQGKIAHIRTELMARLSHDMSNKIIFKLHPTPAVSGLPVHLAKNTIEDIESEPRKYYTGFLGLKEENKYKFYVNLRSMEIKDKHLIIYAGGGILENSVPQKEWEEIKNKANILYKILISA